MGSPIVQYESGQTAYAFEEMSDAGASKAFDASFAPISRAAGAEPTIAPYGVKTGGAITATGTNNQVSVAALTVVAPGMTGADSEGVVAVASGAIAITRAVSTNTHMINSITVDSTGSIAAIAGTGSTSFSESRGSVGGPPLIPVGSIELGQVRTISATSAVLLPSEIYQVAGLHQERSDYPVYTVNDASGVVNFLDALPLIHTGSKAKKVFIKGSTPLFVQMPRASDWSPAESTYSISSTDTYDGPVGSSSSSLNQASFNVLMDNGIVEDFVSRRGQNLWFEFRPDRDKTLPKQLTQGIFGMSRSFPAGGGKASASCTVTPSEASVDVTS